MAGRPPHLTYKICIHTTAHPRARGQRERDGLYLSAALRFNQGRAVDCAILNYVYVMFTWTFSYALP